MTSSGIGADPRTRRSLIGGAAAVVAAHTLAGRLLSAQAADRQEESAPQPPGIPTQAIAATADGRTVWSTDTHSTTITSHQIAGLERDRSIDVGGAPIGIAIAPAGDLALVTTAFYDQPGLALVDLRTDQVERLAVGPEPYAVAFAADGRSAYVSGGGADGTLSRVDTDSGRVHPPIPLGPHPRGLAVLGSGKRALVALNGAGELALVSLASARVRRIATAPFPNQLAVSPDGKRAFATHNGFGADAVTAINLDRAHAGRPIQVGRDPAGVAFSRSGASALVAATGAGTVTLLDGRSGRLRRVFKPGESPRSVAVAGRKGVVADARSGRLTAFPLGVAR